MLVPVASVGSATAVELVTNNARAAVTPDAAAGIRNLDIKRSPQKLKEAHRSIARAVWLKEAI
jgi:hypothetical protein